MRQFHSLPSELFGTLINTAPDMFSTMSYTRAAYTVHSTQAPHNAPYRNLPHNELKFVGITSMIDIRHSEIRTQLKPETPQFKQCNIASIGRNYTVQISSVMHK